MANVTPMVPKTVQHLRDIAREGKITTWVLVCIEDGQPTMIPDGEVEAGMAFDMLFEGAMLAWRQSDLPEAG